MGMTAGKHATGAGLPVELLAAVKAVEQAALDAVREQLRQCKAHDDMLSPSAASRSATLAHKTAALTTLQETHRSGRIAGRRPAAPVGAASDPGPAARRP